MSRRGAVIAVAFIALVWGYNWIVMKVAVRDMAPFEFLGWRFALAALCLFAALALRRRPTGLAHAPQVFLVALFSTTGGFALTTWALHYGDAGKSAVLNYTMPLWVAVFAWPLIGERPRRAQWIALGIAIAGLACLVGPGARPGVAEGLALAAGMVWGLGVVLTKRLQLRANVDALSLSAWQTLIGGAMLVALAVAFPAPPARWSTSLVLAIVYNGVLVSGVCWFLWFRVLERLPAGVASLAILSVPVVGALLGVVLLGERPRTVEWAGMALIVAAITIIGIASARR